VIRALGRALFVPVCTGALAFVVLAPILMRPGMPLFLHDWVWSPYAARTLWTWHFTLSAWRQTGLGEANSAISLNPLAWMKVALAAVLSGRASLECYLFFSVWAAIGGVYDIARRGLGASLGQALASAGVFSATPLLFDKIASGQSSYWAATAAFTWGLSWWLVTLETGRLRDAARACALFALSTVQLQFLIFAGLAYAGAAIVYRRRRVLAYSAGGAAGAASLAITQLWFLALRGPQYGADISPAYRSWIAAQSASTADAFAMLGYAARYAERAIGSDAQIELVRLAAYALAFFACMALALDRRPAVVLTGLLGAAGLLVTLGAFGPFGALVAQLSLGATYLGFFREFYHASVLYAIALAVLAPLGLARLGRRARIASVVLPVALALGLGIATWSGGLGRVLPFVLEPAYGDSLRTAIARQEARVLFLPAQQPLAVAGDAVGGNDGIDWVDAARHSVYRYYLPPLVARAEALLALGDARAARPLLGRLGIAAVIDRADVASRAFAAPLVRARMHDTLRAAFGAPQTLAPGIDLFTVRAAPLVGTALEAGPLPADLAFGDRSERVFLDDPGTDAADLATGLADRAPSPALGWIRRRDAAATLAADVPATSYGLITTRADATATLHHVPAGYALVWAPAGLDIGSGHVRSARPARVSLAAGDYALRSHGAAAISEVGERAALSAVAFAPASIADFAHRLPWHYRFRLTLDGRSCVVLRETYDSAWKLSAPGLRVESHRRADGFANAWIVAGRGTYEVDLDYATQALGFTLLALSALAYLPIAGLALLPESWWKRSVPKRDASDAT
jgi:hypothetical protein